MCSLQVNGLLHYAPVQGNSSQGEDAGVHGEKNDEVHDFTEHRTKHPFIQSVDGGLKGHTEHNEAEISCSQVEDEQVGAFGVHLSAAEQNREHQRVSHRAEQENQRKPQRDQHRLYFPRGGDGGREIHLYVAFILNSQPRGFCPLGSRRRASRLRAIFPFFPERAASSSCDAATAPQGDFLSANIPLSHRNGSNSRNTSQFSCFEYDENFFVCLFVCT